VCPVGMPPRGPETAADYADEAISDLRVNAMVAETGAKFKIIITDACRVRPPPADDPIVNRSMKGSGGGGAVKTSFVALQQSDMAVNTYVVHSSGEATPSFAGDARSMSVFTAKLVPLLGEPGLELISLGRKLQRAMRVASEKKGCKMICVKTDKMEDDYYFNGERVSGGGGGYGVGEGKYDGAQGRGQERRAVHDCLHRNYTGKDDTLYKLCDSYSTPPTAKVNELIAAGINLRYKVRL